MDIKFDSSENPGDYLVQELRSSAFFDKQNELDKRKQRLLKMRSGMGGGAGDGGRGAYGSVEGGGQL